MESDPSITPATKADLAHLREWAELRFAALVQRIEATERLMEQRFEAMERSIEQRFEAFEQLFNERLDRYRKDTIATLTWRMLLMQAATFGALLAALSGT